MHLFFFFFWVNMEITLTKNFGPYFFFKFWSILFNFLYLVPKIKNVFYFGLYCYLTNENCLRGK